MKAIPVSKLVITCFGTRFLVLSSFQQKVYIVHYTYNYSPIFPTFIPFISRRGTLHTPWELNPQLRCLRSNALIQPVQLTTAPNLLYFAYLCFRFSELSFAPCLSAFSP